MLPAETARSIRLARRYLHTKMCWTRRDDGTSIPCATADAGLLQSGSFWASLFSRSYNSAPTALCSIDHHPPGRSPLLLASPPLPSTTVGYLFAFKGFHHPNWSSLCQIHAPLIEILYLCRFLLLLVLRDEGAMTCGFNRLRKLINRLRSTND